MTSRSRDLSKRLLVLLTTIVSIYFGPGALLPAAWACPMCSENLPTGAESATPGDGDVRNSVANSQVSLAAGFYYSILFMLAVPFSMVLGLGGALYFQLRKASAGSLATTSL